MKQTGGDGVSFRFCVIGAGNIAGKFANAVAMIEDCGIMAVASKSLARAEAFAKTNGIDRAYGDYESMLKAERPDGAYIATTCDSHARLSALCVDYGVPVLCEKAMFSDEREAGRVQIDFVLTQDAVLEIRLREDWVLVSTSNDKREEERKGAQAFSFMKGKRYSMVWTKKHRAQHSGNESVRHRQCAK